jgi:hypothetical protein
MRSPLQFRDRLRQLAQMAGTPDHKLQIQSDDVDLCVSTTARIRDVIKGLAAAGKRIPANRTRPQVAGRCSATANVSAPTATMGTAKALRELLYLIAQSVAVTDLHRPAVSSRVIDSNHAGADLIEAFPSPAGAIGKSQRTCGRLCPNAARQRPRSIAKGGLPWTIRQHCRMRPPVRNADGDSSFSFCSSRRHSHAPRN